MGVVDGMLFFSVVKLRGVLTVIMTATIPVVGRHGVTRNPWYQWYPAGSCSSIIPCNLAKALRASIDVARHFAR